VDERFRGVTEEARKEFAIYGTPEQIINHMQILANAGIDYLIVNFEPG
jgi:alkanesulfonate monooxygenase SsuD/methylene tetrahydromethanopterin reductase-like flavin-dependent oxidoreductase (luciferase family)